MKWYKADLHLHSVLSPCGSLEMSPKAVIKTAKERGIDIISITDHNSFSNSLAYKKIAEDHGLTYIFGCEIQSAEEIHIISLFDNWLNAKSFNEFLYKTLIPIENDPNFFGDQVVVDEDENIVRFEERALINSSMLSYEDIFEKINEFGGFAYPAHVNAASYSAISQLGIVPDNIFAPIIEVTAKCDKLKLLEEYPYLEKFEIVRSSDAHYLKDIGSGLTEFFLEEPSLKEIILACKNQKNRKLRS